MKYRIKRKVVQPADLIERQKLADKRVKKLRQNITNSEMRVMVLLDKLPYSYIFQYAIFNEWYFIIADYFLKEINLMIEIDGSQHEAKESRKKEYKRKIWLREQGIEVLRIKNKATVNLTAQQLSDRIRKVLSKKTTR